MVFIREDDGDWLGIVILMYAPFYPDDLPIDPDACEFAVFDKPTCKNYQCTHSPTKRIAGHKVCGFHYPLVKRQWDIIQNAELIEMS